MTEQEFREAVAAIQAEIQRGQLALQRDIYGNISLPTSQAGLTGFIPGGYGGGYGGL